MLPHELSGTGKNSNKSDNGITGHADTKTPNKPNENNLEQIHLKKDNSPENSPWVTLGELAASVSV